MRTHGSLRTSGARQVMLVGALVLLNGCGGAEPGDAPGDAPWGSLESAPEFRLTQEYRLGGVEAAEQEAFSREPRIAVRSGGELFLLDQGSAQVYEFTPDGTFVRGFGGEGDGPAEFNFASDLGLVGDTVWVRNLPTPFLNLFDLEGGFLRRHAMEELAVGRTGMPDGPDAMLDGGVHVSIAQVPLGGEPGQQRVPVRLVSADEAVDTAGFVMDPPGPYAPGAGSLGASHPGSVPPRWAVTPGGGSLVFIDWDASGAVTIREVRPDGAETLDTLRLPVVPFLPGAVDSIVTIAADSVRARIERTRARLPPEIAPTVPSDLEDRIRNALALGSSLPPVRSFLVGTDGARWIERPIAPNRWEWAVFDRELRPVGRVSLPEGHALRAATTTAIWTTHTDALDVPYVTKFELVVGG